MNQQPATTSPATPKMITRHYRVRFLTPAFLGDAEQNARWRTPPFKHLLREWWRVAYFADHEENFSLEAMRREEGQLFGNAWLDNEFRKSLVRLRLQSWSEGKMKQWNEQVAGVKHPEVPNPVGSDLYLGYGPLVYSKQTRSAALKANAAIQASELAEFRLAAPTSHPDAALNQLCTANARRIQRALALIHRFGTLGGRSRNGWGSLVLEGLDDDSQSTLFDHSQLPLRSWKDCLQLDWPHAIGQDNNGPLIWQTEALADWQAVMKRLAQIKIALRTQFELPNKRPDGQIHDRHWLSYPVTRHAVRVWENNARLPNTLRFKVVEAGNGKLAGMIFHVPHKPPPAFAPDSDALHRVWRKVREYLDSAPAKLQRSEP